MGNAGTSTADLEVLRVSTCSTCLNRISLAKALATLSIKTPVLTIPGLPDNSSSSNSSSSSGALVPVPEEEIVASRLGDAGWVADKLQLASVTLNHPAIVFVHDEARKKTGVKLSGVPKLNLFNDRAAQEFPAMLEAINSYDAKTETSSVLVGLSSSVSDLLVRTIKYDTRDCPELHSILGNSFVGAAVSYLGRTSRRSCASKQGWCNVLVNAPSHTNMSFSDPPLDRLAVASDGAGLFMRGEMRKPLGGCEGNLLCELVFFPLPDGAAYVVEARAQLFPEMLSDTSRVFGIVEVAAGLEEITFGSGVVLREVKFFGNIKLRIEAGVADRLAYLKKKEVLNAVLGNPKFTGEAGIRCTVAVPVDDKGKNLVFTGGLSLITEVGAPSIGGPCPSSLLDADGVATCARLTFLMAGMWENAFGAWWLHIGNIALQLTGKFIDPIGTFPFFENFNVLAGAEVHLGAYGGEHAIKMCAYVGFSFVDSMDSFFYARMTKLNLPTLLRAFMNGTNWWVDAIPEELIEIAPVDDQGVLVSFAQVRKRIPVCSSFCAGGDTPDSIPDGDDCTTVQVPQGLRVLGKISLFGYSATIDVEISWMLTNGRAFVNITMEPLKLFGGLVQITRNNVETDTGPYLLVDIPLTDYIWEAIDGGGLTAPVIAAEG